LETKFSPNRGIFNFGDHFEFKMATSTNQNGRHMVQHVLFPVNIHFHCIVERDKPKKSESVGQTFPQLPWKQKRGDLRNVWIPFIKLHETL
jgi:hypothetical protein